MDEFYDRNVKLIISAEVELKDLYTGGRLEFEFQRTLSRLLEMQSHEYRRVRTSPDREPVAKTCSSRPGSPARLLRWCRSGLLPCRALQSAARFSTRGFSVCPRMPAGTSADSGSAIAPCAGGTAGRRSWHRRSPLRS